MKTPLRSLIALTLPAFFASNAVFGQATWIGADNANWNVGGNWSGTPPADNSTSALIFNSASNRTSVNGLTNLTASSITVSGGADNNLAGNDITLDGNFIVQTGSWQRTTQNMVLTAGAKVFDIQYGFLFVGYDFSWSSPSGTISGPGGLTKTGGGSLSLAKQNTYTGGTIVDAGTLQLDTGGSAGAFIGNVTVNSGGLIYSKVGDSFGYSSGTKVNILNIVGGTVTHDSGSNLTLSSVAVNMTAGTLQTIGTGGLDLYDNGTGNTSFNISASSSTATIAGKLNLRAGDNDPTGTVFTVADGSASTDLLISATLANGSAQGANSAVQKTGAGTLVTTNANTYTGATTVTAGSFFVNGTHIGGGNYSVSGILAGSGTITPGSSGTITINSGGVIAPGASLGSIGTLTLDGGSRTGAVASFTSGASFSFDLDASTVTSDRLALANGAAGDFVFDGNVINFTSIVGTLLANQNYTLFSASAADNYSGLTLDGANRITAGLSIGTGLGSGFSGSYLSLVGSDIVLTTAIPEPSTFATLAGFGCLGLALYRRRRQ